MSDPVSPSEVRVAPRLTSPRDVDAETDPLTALLSVAEALASASVSHAKVAAVEALCERWESAGGEDASGQIVAKAMAATVRQAMEVEASVGDHHGGCACAEGGVCVGRLRHGHGELPDEASLTFRLYGESGGSAPLRLVGTSVIAGVETVALERADVPAERASSVIAVYADDFTPVHLYVPVDAAGDGPVADEAGAVRWVCWCMASDSCGVLPARESGPSVDTEGRK